MNKKKIFFLILILLFCALGLITNNNVEDNNIFCKSVRISNNSEIEDNVDEQLEKLDFSKLDGIFEGFNAEEKEILKSNSFLNLVKNLIYEENFSSFQEVFPYLIKLIFNNVLQNLPLFILIFIISMLYGIIENSQFIKTNGTKFVVCAVCGSPVL